MNTLTISAWKTLKRAVGDILVNSNKKVMKSEPHKVIENMCSTANMIGSSLKTLKLGRRNYPEMKAKVVTRISWCVL